ncbi:hypothetical protein HDU93_000949 [Gonapodya sp. JEL0774]|nr:hypothetical protein HDU93_000949 [Gonapodya sp. JEL0774]
MCRAGAIFSSDGEANVNVSPIDAAFPGTLPRLNHHCLTQAIKASLALGCTIHSWSAFDRKHYFYNDIPLGYQITQHYSPLATKGRLTLTEADGFKTSEISVGIRQLQIEQDTGKSLLGDSEGEILVDLNRAGAGLMEIVTEPDMRCELLLEHSDEHSHRMLLKRSSTEATALLGKIARLLDHVGVLAEGGLEEGSLRCDVNVSVARADAAHQDFGTRCEIKNLNSVRAVGKAIDYEIARQIATLESGIEIAQETRGFDPESERTVLLRTKENAVEYRYMPDPDLPPVIIADPPYSLSPYTATLIVNEPGCSDLFTHLTSLLDGDAQAAANWITGPVFEHLRARIDGSTLRQRPIDADTIAEVGKLVKSERISNLSGKYLLRHVLEHPSRSRSSVLAAAHEMNFIQESSDTELHRLCDELFLANPDKVELIVKGGRHSLLPEKGTTDQMVSSNLLARISRAESGKRKRESVYRVLPCILVPSLLLDLVRPVRGSSLSSGHESSDFASSPHLRVRQSNSTTVNRMAVPGVISDTDSSAIGLACTIDEDCVRVRQDGTFDRTSYCDDASATCVALGTLDSPCITNSQCVANTFCSGGVCSPLSPKPGLPAWVFVFPALTAVFFVLFLFLFYTWIRGLGIFRKVGPAQLPTITLHTIKPSAPDIVDFWHAHSPFSDDRRPKSPSSTLPRPHDIPEVAKGFSQEIKPSPPVRRPSNLNESLRKQAVQDVTFLPDTIPGEDTPSVKVATLVDDAQPVPMLSEPQSRKANGNLTYPDFSGNGKVPPSPPRPVATMPMPPSWPSGRRSNDSDSWAGEDAREFYEYPDYETSGAPAGLGRKATMLFQQHPGSRDHTYTPTYREQSYQTDGRHDMYPEAGPSIFNPGPWSLPHGYRDESRGNGGPVFRNGGERRAAYGTPEPDGSNMVRRMRLPAQFSAPNHSGRFASNVLDIRQNDGAPGTLLGSMNSDGTDGDVDYSPRERMFVEERRRIVDNIDEDTSMYSSMHGLTASRGQPSFPLTTPDGRWRWDGQIAYVLVGRINGLWLITHRWSHEKRAYADLVSSTDFGSPYRLVPSSLNVQVNSGMVVGDVLNTRTKDVLSLEVHILQDGNVVRLRMKEKSPKFPKRWDDLGTFALAAGPGGPKKSKNFRRLPTSNEEYSGLISDAETEVFKFELGNPGSNKILVIHAGPLRVDLLVDDTTVMSVNERGYFNFEARQMGPGSSSDSKLRWPWADLDLDSELKGKLEKDPKEESFNGKSDSKPYGPESFGIDVTFPNVKNVYGLPEHASSFSLKATRGAEAPYNEPYRGYNADVFEYELNNPMSLYGIVPLVVAHRSGWTGGALLLSSAELWVDIEQGTNEKTMLSHVRTTVRTAMSSVSDYIPEVIKQSPFSKYLLSRFVPSLSSGDDVVTPSKPPDELHSDDAKPDRVPSPFDSVPSSRVHFMTESGPLDLILFSGPTWPSFFRQYGQLTGTAALPQQFAIAYHQCRWNYIDEKDVSEVDENFDKHDIPMDVLWLDIEHTDSKKYFTWDSVKFPNPKDMLSKLAVKGRQMVTITDPHVKKDSGYFLYQEAQEKGLQMLTKDKTEFDGWCWPGSSIWPDFLKDVTRKWWASQYSLDKYEGSSETLWTWIDMNEPSVFTGPEITAPKDALHENDVEHRAVHNIYGFLQNIATYEGLLARQKGTRRPFILSRSFFVGTQRYGAIWTGDNMANWEHLAASVPMMLSLNVAGITFSGADVGGFFGNPDPDLFTRWFQAGAYQPFFRGHSHIDAKRKEPWVFDDATTSLVRAAIMERYRLLPYWYTLFFEAHVTGVPVMRAMVVEFPRDENVFGMEDQYMVGAAIMVKPVVAKDTTSVAVYLPDNETWYDYDTFTVVKGTLMSPTYATVVTPLDKIPVFLRGGHIVPRRDRPRRSSALMAMDPYTLVVALDREGKSSGLLYADDGSSFDYLHRGAYVLRRFVFDGTSLSSRAVDPVRDLQAVVEMGGPAEDGGEAGQAGVRVERVVVAGLRGGLRGASVRWLGVGGERDVEVEWTVTGSATVFKMPPGVRVGGAGWRMDLEW